MALTDEEKAYIREIMNEAYDDRIKTIEQKLFNGIGSSITWLWRLMVMLLSGMFTVIFIKLRG